MKYEYTFIKENMGLKTLHVNLNEMGEEGWECYQIRYESAGLMGTYTAFLRRVKK